jgi:F-type H+-transporting ATPase subunit epsilon
MQLEIITPEKKVFEGEVSEIMVPGSNGRFQMLENHASIISTLVNGTVKIKTTAGIQTFEMKGGVVELLNNKVIILAESI